MKQIFLTLLAFAFLSSLFAAEGDILLFDEFRNPQESGKNWFSYMRKLPAGDLLYFDKTKAFIENGAIKLTDSRLFSSVKNIRNCEVEFELQMAEDRVENGRHHGYVGFELRPFYTPPDTNDREIAEKERSFRVFCQIGRPMPLHDIRAADSSPHRTAGISGMSQSKMPVMEAGRWYKMRLICRDQEVGIWIDGIEIGIVKPRNEKDRFNQEGRVALWAHAGTALFRNILIRGLGETEKQ